jgi:transcriptional regulator with XRE-family HTH domain
MTQKPYQEINNMSERMTPNKQIGSAIRAVRKSKGLTQAQLGVLIGKADNTICDYESGKTELLITVFLDIVTALNIDIAEFFGQSAKKPHPKKKK